MANQYTVRRNEDGTYFVFDKKSNSGSSDYSSRKKARDVANRLNKGEKYIVGYTVYNVELGEITFTGFMSEESAQESCDKLNSKLAS